VRPVKTDVFSEKKQARRDKSQNPVAWMAACSRDRDAEAHRQSYHREDCESAGCNASKRRCGLENFKIRRSSLQNRVKTTREAQSDRRAFSLWLGKTDSMRNWRNPLISTYKGNSLWIILTQLQEVLSASWSGVRIRVGKIRLQAAPRTRARSTACARRFSSGRPMVIRTQFS